MRSRILGILIAVTAVFGALALAAGPASAEQRCTGGSDANLCLTIEGRSDGLFNVDVGIDIHIPLDAAQEYIDDPGDPVAAVIWGDEGNETHFVADERLGATALVDLGATAEFGLSADFHTVMSGFQLNEDNGQDEIRAVVTLTDTDTNTSIDFVSRRIVGNWP